MWKSPLDESAPEKAYAKNQVTKVLSFDEFVKHISDHNGVFTRGTVKGVVSDTCSCLVEQLLNGRKVQFGELGTFGISITCDPTESIEKFSAKNIKVSTDEQMLEYLERILKICVLKRSSTL